MQASREALAELFENAPAFVERLAEEDADNWETLFERALAVALSMPSHKQIELLNAHPRIGARPAAISALSHLEQAYDRDPGTAELEARLDRLNEEYEERFGFRFVVFVNGRSREQIADVLAGRMQADRQAELERGLCHVIAIARDRQRRMEAV
jgi:2-oxo-4-hydroxy-4-carboxy--5-ureidoimidazoline (OHCU) decarboxylase